MLKYMILLICSVMFGMTAYAQPISKNTTTQEKSIRSVDFQTINHIFADLRANTEYADSLYSENVLLRNSVQNCGSAVHIYSIKDSTNISIVQNQNLKIKSQQRKVKLFKWLSVGGCVSLLTLIVQNIITN